MPGMSNFGKIESLQTEDYVFNEGYITYDIRFHLYYQEKNLKIIINIEAQNSSDSVRLRYHLENRIQFYLARLVSAQKGTEFLKVITME